MIIYLDIDLLVAKGVLKDIKDVKKKDAKLRISKLSGQMPKKDKTLFNEATKL